MVSFITVINARTSRSGTSGAYSVHFVFLRGRVTQGDFLLIINPVLIVGPQARVKDPLFKPPIALGEIFRDRVSRGPAGVTG